MGSGFNNLSPVFSATQHTFSVFFDTIYRMDKRELEQRCAEMKTRMLARKAPSVQPVRANQVEKRTPGNKTNPEQASSPFQLADPNEIRALKDYIAKLEAENRTLRQQIAAMSVRATEPRRSTEDSVREQRHNFFKYSNIRRY